MGVIAIVTDSCLQFSGELCNRPKVDWIELSGVVPH